MLTLFKTIDKPKASLIFFLFVIILDYLWIGARYTELYTEVGLLPLNSALSKNLFFYYLGSLAEFILSIHYVAFAGLFLCLGLILLRGVRTISVCGLIFCLFVLQFRNVWILDGGDSFTIFFLYWILLFISISDKHRLQLQYIFGLQLAFIYISNGFLKSGASWTETGTALKIIWSQPYISYSWINALVDGVELKWLTLAALYLERILPLLLVFRKYKWAAYFFIPYHIVIFFTVRIDFFALVNVASWLILLYPPEADQKRQVNQKRDYAILTLGSVILVMGVAQFTLTQILKKPLPEKVLMGLSLVRLNQDWRMFTPDPRFTSYDYSFNCVANGESRECPKDLKELEKVENWGRRRKQFFIKLAEKKNGYVLHESFHQHLCLRYPEFDAFEISIKAKIKNLDQPNQIEEKLLDWPLNLRLCKKKSI